MTREIGGWAITGLNRGTDMGHGRPVTSVLDLTMFSCSTMANGAGSARRSGATTFPLAAGGSGGCA